MTEPFSIGDQIVFGNFEGTIEEIETRATKMRTYDGRLVVIPNADLHKGSFIVNTAYPTRRLHYDVVIANGDDIALAKKIMLATIHDLPGIEPEPAPNAHVMAYADAGVAIRLRWWIKPPRRADVLAMQDQVLEQVKAALTANGIDLPYPTDIRCYRPHGSRRDHQRNDDRQCQCRLRVHARLSAHPAGNPV